MRTEARVSRRVVAVGAVTVALAVVVAVLQSSVANAVLRGLMVLAVVPCAAIDLEKRIIPNWITGPGSAVAVIAGLALDPGGELGRVLWALGAGGFLLVASLIRPSGMGMGDVKLTGMIGLFLGRSVVVALLAALIASVLTGVALATRRGVHAARKTALPFGPYLAFGATLAALVGDQIVHAYLHLHH
jgi:leader peptidase (prepilin peptidase) / N-methyltransferase